MKKITLILTALFAAGTIIAQDIAKEQQDSLLNLMNDSTYWDNIQLGEVVVKSSLPKTRVKDDAMRTTVTGSVLEKAGSATDALNKIPLLKAEKGGVPEVTGRGAAEVYINGRKVQDMNELDRLRSDDIQYVDVVTAPGARYSASTKAVVRITMKKKKGEGFSFLEQAGGTYQYGWSGTNNLDLNYRTGGLDVTGSFWGGSFGHSRENHKANIMYYVGNDYYEGRTTQDASSRFNGFSPQLQLNYMINQNHSLGAYYKFDRNTNTHLEGWLNMDNFVNGNLSESMRSDISENDNSSKHIFNAYYSGRVAKLSIDWNFDGLFSKTIEDRNTKETTTYYDNYPQKISNINCRANTSIHFWSTKLILSYPVWKGSLSAGGEYTNTNREELYTIKSDEQLPISNSDTRLKESSFSGFVEYGRAFGNFNVMAGVRYEHLKNDYFNFGVRQDEVCRSYGDWFPTATVAYRFDQGPQLSLSYRKDIQRPHYSDLSSSVVYLNKYTYQSGNPYLKPVYTHNLTLNAAYDWMNLMLMYKNVRNQIVSQSMPYPESPDPMITLFKPINSPDPYSSFIISFSARPVFGIWHPNWQVLAMFQNYKTMSIDKTMITLNKPLLNITWDNDFVLPHDWRINAFIAFCTKGDINTSSILSPMWDNTIGIQKDFKTQSLGSFTLDLRCRDPFNVFKSHTLTYGTRHCEVQKKAMRTFSLNVTWRFNEASKKYKGQGSGKDQLNRM
ncbi:MAG: TonB-dependent receptor [Muribaculaceae bacterium]|nr:TonB-dependent receptor [Muribaculaceae bacterium]